LVNAVELISEVEDALINIPNIERAHQKENNRAYSAALEEYIAASFLAPNNRYLQRHIAKIYAAIGKLKLSANYWEAIIAQEESASHYLRYAHVLARMGDSQKANDCFGKAYALDEQNPRILVEWGDFLVVECRYQEAIHQYEAALKLEISDKNQIWLRLAEVSFDQGDADKALSYIHLVLDRLPDHQDARRLMLKVLKNRRGNDEVLN
jgi:tetratricopeptide (TPR) repeat protein